MQAADAIIGSLRFSFLAVTVVRRLPSSARSSTGRSSVVHNAMAVPRRPAVLRALPPLRSHHVSPAAGGFPGALGPSGDRGPSPGLERRLGSPPRPPPLSVFEPPRPCFEPPRLCLRAVPSWPAPPAPDADLRHRLAGSRAGWLVAWLAGWLPGGVVFRAPLEASAAGLTDGDGDGDGDG
jgi:hypothetical protein